MHKRNNSWNLPTLVFLHLLVAFLVTSLFMEPLASLWKPFDLACFKFLNGLISDSPFWQNFWAMANHRLADWVEDICFLLIFIYLIMSVPRELRLKKAAECLFILAYGVFIILMANEVLFRVLLDIKRSSPSLVVDSFTNLPEKATWLKVKAKSFKSFPGDHGTTALLSIVGFFYLSEKNYKAKIVTTLYGLFLCLPRLIAGAHWATDVLIGGGSIITIFFAWAFCTPLAQKSSRIIERFLTIFFPKKRTSL